MRPKQLERCITSIRNQTDQDYEHLLIPDDKGQGLHWANTQIYENRNRVTGKWVYVLDDDDWLTDSCFIEDLKKIDSANNVDIVICKGYIGDILYPLEDFWGAIPRRGSIGSPNFIVKKDLFLKTSYNWCKPKAGDFYFIHIAMQLGKTHWWNKEVFKAPIGNGIPE